MSETKQKTRTTRTTMMKMSMGQTKTLTSNVMKKSVMGKMETENVRAMMLHHQQQC